jgi:hypothetical protein
MLVKPLIDKVLITLEIGDKTVLFILLANDGTSHRKGNGSQNTTDLPLKTGISYQGHFDALMMTVNENIFNYTGVINQPGRRGEECRLTLIFQGINQTDYSFRVIYGADSEGPPVELAQILINAVKLTEEWYNEQLTVQPEKKKKWWQL